MCSSNCTSTGRPVGQHRHAGAAVVRQQFLEVAEVAGQHRQVDVVAAEVGVVVGAGAVAALEDDVDHLAQRLEQGEEDVEEPLGRDRRREHRQPEPRWPVAEDLDAVAFARAHGHVRRRAGPRP